MRSARAQQVLRGAAASGVILGAVALVPGAASAASVSGEVADTGFADFTFWPGSGEANRLTVATDKAGRVVFTDRGAPVVAKGDCVQLRRNRARCPRAEGKIMLRLGDRNDRLRVRGFRARAQFVRFVEARGGEGHDLLVGDEGVDYLNGNGGNDRLRGRDAGDNLRGGRGNDLIRGGGGRDTINGGRGADHIQGRDDGDFIRGGRHNDLLKGGGGADDIKGGRGNDHIQGRDGDDLLLLGGRGNDLIKGGRGDDRLLGDHHLRKGGADHLRGGDGDDVLLGGDRNDWLKGGDGDDQLFGDLGSDRLEGRAGNDLLVTRSVNEDFSVAQEPDTAAGGSGVDRVQPDVQDTIKNAEFVSVWRTKPLDPDHDLHLGPQPRIDGESATFAASCGTSRRCVGRITLTDVGQLGPGEELGTADFDLPRTTDPPREIRVELSPDAAARLRDGSEVAVHLEPSDDSEVRERDWGYRAFMQGG